MSIKLRFQKGSYVTQVTLKDEALPAIHQLISTYHDEDQSQPPEQNTESRLREFSSPAEDEIGDLNDSNKERTRIDTARSWLKDHSSAEALNKVGWQTFSEQILVLGAFYQAHGGGEGWRASDIDSLFSASRVTPPTNFARDISNAIKAGVVATVTPRTYKVSRTGWLRLYERIILSAARDAFPAPAPKFGGGPEIFTTEGMPEL